jgi:putative colanic acid biosysnthesis UDP-glucose lipid carrier transferase
MQPRLWMRDGAGESPLIALIAEHLYPAIAVVTLLLSAIAYGQHLGIAYGVLALLTFVIAVQFMTRPRLEAVGSDTSWQRDLRHASIEWGCVVLALLCVGLLFRATGSFSRKAMLTWIVLTPFALTGAQDVARRITGWRRRLGAMKRRVVVVGAGKVGCELATRLCDQPWLGSVDGFFDDRRVDRLPRAVRARLLGRFSDIAEYSRRNQVHVIYLCLPMSAQARIRAVLDALRDSTASIYLVPDLSAFDLMQPRFGEVSGLPLLAMRESPFCGMTGVSKRISDVLLALLAVLVTAPIMIAIAVGVWRSSPGPILFRQRRYGLDGKEFQVYKFRSMTVCEDGEIQQATRHDPRVTKFGRWLRRSSLDELPQLFNVINGSMSLVGPRPHAVAHNEHYRGLVSGYMLRHKVRPGITGLAQVNGQRGETNNLRKMNRRVQFDLEYLNNWSLGLDLRIVLKTVFVVFRSRRAY